MARLINYKKLILHSNKVCGVDNFSKLATRKYQWSNIWDKTHYGWKNCRFLLYET